MKRVSKRVIRILSAIMTVLLLISSLNFPSYAKEEEDDLGVTYQVGDFVQFGKYEQDGDSSNGKEDIEWQILKVESDRVLVISRYALDCKEYNTSFSDVTWETCSLHSWLNNEFLNTAFSEKEQELIPQVIIENNNNPYNGTSGGGNTNDWIFCLSFQEMKTYFGSYNWYDSEHHHGYNQNLICTPTQYAVNNGAQYNEITEESYNNVFKNYGYTSDVIGLRACDWWLRSPGNASNNACPVIGFGLAGDTSYNVIFSSVAVRPALYINTSESTLVINPKSITLDSTSAVLNEGDSMKLVATIQPLLAANKTITWTSSNPSVATVSTDKFNYAATVKATGVGTTKITAKTVNNLTATCEVTVKGGASSDLFADIKVDTWQYKAAKAIYEKGCMTGTGKDGDKIIFSPNTDMNRTMFVQALYSMDGKPEVTYVQKFNDVKESAWYAKAVTWASNNGIVAGNPDGTFGVNGKATREQLALMFYKYAKYKNYDVSVSPSTTLDSFIDAGKVSSWSLEAIKWAVERGIISGKGNASAGYRIAPTEKATRIECAAMMNKFDEVYSKSLKTEDEDLEEHLALPMEEIEDIPVPDEEIEDVVDEEDVEDKEEDSEEEITDEEEPSEMEPEDEADIKFEE